MFSKQAVRNAASLLTLCELARHASHIYGMLTDVHHNNQKGHRDKQVLAQRPQSRNMIAECLVTGREPSKVPLDCCDLLCHHRTLISSATHYRTKGLGPQSQIPKQQLRPPWAHRAGTEQGRNSKARAHQPGAWFCCPAQRRRPAESTLVQAAAHAQACRTPCSAHQARLSGLHRHMSCPAVQDHRAPKVQDTVQALPPATHKASTQV